MLLLALAHAEPLEVPAYELTLLESPMPVFPDDAETRRDRSCPGEVTFDSDGRVLDVEILRCPELFENAAVEALSTWRIEPYLHEERPVPVLLAVNVHFRPSATPVRAAERTGPRADAAEVPPAETWDWWETGSVPPDEPAPTNAHAWDLLVKSPQVPPRRPRLANELGLTGTCFVVVHVDTDGRTYGAEVTDCPDVFVAPSLAAVQRWRFEPLVVDGVPARSSVLIEIPY